MPKLATASVLSGLLLVTACAVGTDEPEIDVGVTPTVPTESGIEPKDDYVAPPPENTNVPTPPQDAGAPPADAAPEAGPGTGSSCAASSSCSGAESLGSITGDDSAIALSSRSVSRTGTTNAWFKVRVTEDVTFILPYDLSVRADLIGPPTGAGGGPQFSVFVYGGSTPTDNACAAAPRAATGSTQSVTLPITDTLSVSDSRDVYVEVRETGNPGTNVCKASAGWSLTITGAE